MIKTEIKKQIARNTPEGAIKATRKEGKIKLETLVILSKLMKEANNLDSAKKKEKKKKQLSSRIINKDEMTN